MISGLLSGLATAPWAMAAPDVEQLLAKLEPSALEAVRPFKADHGKRLGIRDGVGILYVTGPLFKRDSWLTGLLGTTTYETLRKDLQAALDDPKVQSIALYVDSPGGEASGCDELAVAIYEARKMKPTAAFVSGTGCSAGYWLATAAERVTVSQAAVLGSIGVAMAYVDHKKAEEARGVIRHEFVSSKSPNKRAPARTQKLVDDLGEVFIRAIAKQRGVTPETVATKFGAGGVEIGAKAVALGMADAVGDFESVLSALRRRPVPINTKPKPLSGAVAPTVHAPSVVVPPRLSAAEQARIDAAAKAEAQERARIHAIFNSGPGKDREDLASHYAFDTRMPAGEAIEAIQAEIIAQSWRTAAQRLEI